MHGGFAAPPLGMATRSCVVCSRPLEPGAALTPQPNAAASPPELHPVCADHQCRMVFQQGGDMPAAAFTRHLHQRVAVWRRQRERHRLRQAREEAQDREAAAVFAAMTSRGDRVASPGLRLVVPSGHAPARPLSERRRRAYAAHLDAIIAAAFAAPAPEAASSTAEPPQAAVDAAQAVAPTAAPPPGEAAASFSGRLCGFCGGGCCADGGDVAYLSAQTVRRVAAADPDLDPRLHPGRLRAAYLARVAARTVAGSCIHHTRAGCSLPRSLRSDTCNAYACDALKRLQDGVAADPRVFRATVLRRRQNNWRRTEPELDNAIVAAAVLAGSATIRVPDAELAELVSGPAAD